ncbi:MAG: relaxase MobL [Blastocatellales bacterium]
MREEQQQVNAMKVVVVVKKGLGGSGVSQAARYVSTRERDEEREGQEARKLFSENEERLNHSQANRLLGDGRDPKTDDVLHLVISFHREEDFNQLGMDEESRLDGVRKTTRGTLKEMTDALHAERLRWVAGIHRNTDNPHAHLLIHRDYVDRQTGRTKRLDTLPKELRVSWEKAPDGKRIINPGLFSQTFEKHLDQNIKQFTNEQQRKSQEERVERTTLGQAMVASDRIEQLRESFRAAVTFGEWRRYQVVDEQGRSRLISEYDLRQRAGAIGRQMTAQIKFNLPAETRAQMRWEAEAQEIGRYGGVIKKIHVMRLADLNSAELNLQQAISASRPAISKSVAIREKYGTAGLPISTPILSRADLGQLQNRAIFLADAEKLNKLEEIRVTLATEKGEPARLDTETGRLRAQRFVARSRLVVEQQTAARFEEAKHIRQWGVGNCEHQTKYSLAGIESALASASDQAKFIGARSLHWNDEKREVAREKADELSRQRVEVLSRIADERGKLSEEVKRRAEVVKALDEIYAGEKERYRKEGRKLPAMLFTEQDLRELDAHAVRRHDPGVYRTLTTIERDYDAHSHRDPKEVVRERLSCAGARELMAGIEVRESQAKLERFNERRTQMMVITQEGHGPEITLARLADVEPKSPLEQLFKPLLTRSEKYQRVAAAVEKYGERLQQQHKQNQATFAVLAEAARSYEQDFIRLNPGQPNPRPQFTAREISRLELQIIKENDPALREHYAKFYHEALEEPRPGFSRAITLNPTEGKQILDLKRDVPLFRDADHQHATSLER